MLKPGDRFERYIIEAPLGQGGMGCVYRAHDTRLGRRVALKVIAHGAGPGDEPAAEGGPASGAGLAQANARLLREARAAAALDHPNAVAIFDVDELAGAPYIVMELVEGRTLRAVIGEATLPVATRLELLGDVARALGGAHRRGLVHRDIKPENVMVRDDGMVKVLDFGIARRVATGAVDPRGATEGAALSTLTLEGVKLGTPVYMAPEQIRGDALDGRADQFAWGVLAYELLTGRLPWRGASDALAVMASVLTDAVDPAPLDEARVPRAAREVVLRALAKRPEDRFASMDELGSALAAARSHPPPAEVEAPARVPGATQAQLFSTGEVREVLGKAIEREAAKQGSSKLGFDELLAVAAEVGVDADSLREASRALRARSDAPAPLAADPQKRDAWLRARRRDFYRHLGVYVIVNAALLVLGLVLLSFTLWWIWFLPGLAWAIGLAIHGLVALSSNEDDWSQHHQEMQTWHEHRRRRHEERMAALEATAGRRDRRRIAAVVAPGVDKVRVAALDTGRERLAEDEAAATAERNEPARRRL